MENFENILNERLKREGDVEKIEWVGCPKPEIYCRCNRFTSRFWFMCLFVLLAVFSIVIACTSVYANGGAFIGMMAVTAVICGNAVFWFISVMRHMITLDSIAEATMYAFTDKGIHCFIYAFTNEGVHCFDSGSSTFISYSMITSVETTHCSDYKTYGDIIIKSASSEIHMYAVCDCEHVASIVMQHI